jgi:Tfp pilus assembly protein FimV
MMQTQGASALDQNPPRPLRLTRRGRITFVLVVALLIFAAFSVGRVTTKAATPPVPARHVVVQAGETLWTFAERIAPNSDPRVTVAHLEALNHLSSPALVAGQSLLVPGKDS